jgi:hypothetical protein
LSNRLPPRWLFVYENVLAAVPPQRAREYAVYCRLHRVRRAVACYETHPHVSKVIWDLYWRRDFRFDVVTFLGEDYADRIASRLEKENLPFSNCWAVDEGTLARKLAYMPDVLYVVHGDPTHHLAYGNRGLLVTDPGALSL